MTLTEGVNLLAEIDAQQSALEEQLKATKVLRHQLETDKLLELFAIAEAKEHTLTNGVKAKLGLKTAGSLPKVDEEASFAVQSEQRAARALAISIAESYGWGPFIKTTVTAQYDKGDADKADRTFQLLRQDNSAVVTKDETIHPMTLGAQVRQRLREEKAVAMDKLGITVLPAVLLTKKAKG